MMRQEDMQNEEHNSRLFQERNQIFIDFCKTHNLEPSSEAKLMRFCESCAFAFADHLRELNNNAVRRQFPFQFLALSQNIKKKLKSMAVVAGIIMLKLMIILIVVLVVSLSDIGSAIECPSSQYFLNITTSRCQLLICPIYYHPHPTEKSRCI